jgi:excisionase family DNA binding protein
MNDLTIEYWYSIGEVALKMNVAYHTVRRLILDRQIRATKVGKQWRIKKDDLDAYIESRTLHPVDRDDSPAAGPSREPRNGRYWHGDI